MTTALVANHVEWFSRFEIHQNMIWFVIRYSNGAYQEHELEIWSCKRLTAAARRLKYWFDMETKNSANG